MKKRKNLHDKEINDKFFEAILADMICDTRNEEFEIINEYNNKLFSCLILLIASEQPLPFTFVDTMSGKDPLKMGGAISLLDKLTLVKVDDKACTVELNKESPFIKALDGIDLLDTFLKYSKKNVDDSSESDDDADSCCYTPNLNLNEEDIALLRKMLDL